MTRRDPQYVGPLEGLFFGLCGAIGMLGLPALWVYVIWLENFAQ